MPVHCGGGGGGGTRQEQGLIKVILSPCASFPGHSHHQFLIASICVLQAIKNWQCMHGKGLGMRPSCHTGFVGRGDVHHNYRMAGKFGSLADYKRNAKFNSANILS